MSLPLCSRFGVFFVFAFQVFAGSSDSGIENFYQVDQNVFRGAQPSEAGFKYLTKIGVKTVLDLREADQRSRAEEGLVTADGMKYVNIPMTGLAAPTEAEIGRALGILEGGGAVFVHCKRGADRTGVVIATYRIDHDGWDSERALREAKARGMSFLQLPRMSYIRTFRPRVLEAKTGEAKTPLTTSYGVSTSSTAPTPGQASATGAVR
jgi:protein-tyrosine phosphatase